MTQKNMKITTATGSYYEIIDGLWRKNGRGSWEGITSMRGVERRTLTGWDDINNPPEHIPVQLGLSLFISSFDSWWLSTPVVEIQQWETSDEDA